MVSGHWGGVKIAFSKVFKKSNPDYLWFDVSANYLFGGTVTYLDVKNMTEFTDNTNYDGKGYNASFVNLETHEVHQHHVAEIYSSQLRQLDLKLGVLIRL